MTQRALSLSTAVVMLAVYLWSQLQPRDALFLLLSTNLAVNIVLLGLVGLLVRLSFMNKFRTIMGYGAAAGGALACAALGVTGLLAVTFNYNFSWFGPLDFLILAEAGVVLGICALTYEHQPLKLNAQTLTNLAKLPMPRFAFTMPRLALHQLRNLRFD